MWRTNLREFTFDITPQVGTYIDMDDWNHGVWLEHDDTEWELCDFRVPACDGFYHLAVKVEVTGRSLQPRHYNGRCEWVRCAVTFVADPGDYDLVTGEPKEDVVNRGWMLVRDEEMVENPERVAEMLQKLVEAEAKLRADDAERQARMEATEVERKAREQAAAKTKAEAIRRAASRAAALEL